VSDFGVAENFGDGIDYSESTYGFGITPEMRFYVSERKETPKGFFVAPFLTYMHFNSRYEYPDYVDFMGNPIEGSKCNLRSHTAGLGMVLGYQFFLNNRITIDAWAGPGYYLSDIQISENSRGYCYSGAPYFVRQGGGFGSRVGATVGIAF
jgi:hypothetical protein